MVKFLHKIRQNLLSKNKFLSYLLYALGEILLIVIGIFIALQLQNWNEDKKATQSMKLTIERIKNEIITNKKSIGMVYDYHVMVRDTLNKIKPPKTEEEAYLAFSFWRGLNIPRLQQAAFATATQTNISQKIDFELLEKLNALYTIQESYNEFSKTAAQGLYTNDFSEIKNFKKIAMFISMTMVDLNYFENNLESSFDECLLKIQESLEK